MPRFTETSTEGLEVEGAEHAPTKAVGAPGRGDPKPPARLGAHEFVPGYDAPARPRRQRSARRVVLA
jgi:hypothetical protein